jgi:hypothetical protein
MIHKPLDGDQHVDRRAHDAVVSDGDGEQPARPGPGAKRPRPRRCGCNAFRVHPPGASDDPRGALTALSLDTAKVAVNAALSTRFR